MARALVVVALIATTISLSLSSVLCSDASEHFFVEGKVYCDTCRVQFVTRVSEYLPGAKVRLECRQRNDSTLTYSTEGETDKNGVYTLPVDGDHEEEICEVKALKSPREDCNEHFADYDQKARVVLTDKTGVTNIARYASPLGFMKKEALPVCAEVLKELFPPEEEDA
ncbi:olee1-like protein [Ziziphus jujuba]|uniref:Olee1-like protein n=1 Tax=Ziziphus jujuba TaxID=326968 RepID=A0A6P4ARG0_ZIZJJ|nr:olee1-like protein [Ziziphus jujuba]